MSLRRTALVVLTLSLLGAACSSKGDAGGGNCPAAHPSTTIAAAAASSDLYAGAPQRVLIGVTQQDQSGVKLASGGTASFCFEFLGSGAPVAGPTVTANYVPAPGLPGSPDSSPTFETPSVSRGVYQAEGITFDQPGTWQVTVSIDISPDGEQVLTAALPVAATPQLPARGQPALKTENHTVAEIGRRGVTAASIDSRATGDTVPDPNLHTWTIAKAIAEHRPALVVFATPVYCVSQFCGPDVDAVEQLSKQYGNRAVFIHVEIYAKKTAQKTVINRAAADWLYRNGDLTEPWTFLIGSNGKILDRWGSVWSVDEVGNELAKLPVMKG